MKRLTLTTIAAALVGGLSLSGVAQADFSANMSRISADAASGSGDTVRGECGAGVEGWDGATATIENTQEAGSSRVKIRLKDAIPNTLFTVWIRQKGNDQDGASFGGSPITGGGATPLAASTHLGQLVADWVGSGSADQPNGFHTNHKGDGIVHLDLDFPVEGGAYPFNNMSAGDLAVARGKNSNARAIPNANVDPRQAGVSGPFLIRMVSHCQDGLGHGLSPANRESWFQYP